MDAATGKRRWESHTEPDSGETLGEAVRFVAGTVVAGDYELFGFDARTGAKRWRFHPTDGYGAGVYLGETDSQSVFAGSPAGRLYSVDAADGRQNWSIVISNQPKATVFAPIVNGDDVLCSYTTFGSKIEGGVAVAARSTGALRWRFAFPPSARDMNAARRGGGPVADARRVYAAAGDGRIYVLSRDDGAIEATIPAIQIPGKAWPNDFRALAIVESTLVAASQSGFITGYSTRNAYRQVWRIDSNFGSGFELLVAPSGTVYVPTFSGVLIAIDAKAGREQWQIGGPSERYSWLPAAIGKRTYVASATGLSALTW